jgi:uncharacterized membrane protein
MSTDSETTGSSSGSSSGSSGPTPSIGQEIYADAAGFGRIWAVLGAVFSTIVGLFIIIMGIILLFTKKKIKLSVGIKSITPVGGGNPSDNIYSYSITLKDYTINNKVYSNITKHYNGYNLYTEADSVDIYYTKEKPSDITLDKPIPHYIGFLMILVGIIIPLMAWIWVWATRRSKFLAAAVGVGGGINIAESIF